MAFASRQALRALSTSAARHAIQNVTVIGGGLMGSGIAQVAAQTGHNVTMVELSEDILNKTSTNIQKSLSRVAKKMFENQEEGGKFMAETMGRLTMETDVSAGVQNADLVIEAIVENINIKQKLFATLDEAAPQSTIFVSNTSSLPIAAIAAATKRPDRVSGLHFFNPVPVMKLVEVVKTSETSEDTTKALQEFARKMGKTSVQAKDTPGFIVNRLLVPYIMESIRMLERGDATKEDIDVAMKLGAGVPMGPVGLADYCGLDITKFVNDGVASKEDIDTAMKLGSGVPMGPITLADYVGLDTLKFINDGWHESYPDQQLFEPCELLNKVVAEGKLGIKSGEGFYSYK